jgi:hypothetical protein
MVCVGVLLAFFYNVVVSWALWYLLVSVLSLVDSDSSLEWAYCGHDYNSAFCHSDLEDEKCNEQQPTKKISFNQTGCQDLTPNCCHNQTSSVEEYWDRHVLARLDHDWGNYVRMQNRDSLIVLICHHLCVLCIGQSPFPERSSNFRSLVSGIALPNKGYPVLWQGRLRHIATTICDPLHPCRSEFHIARRY